MKFKSHIFFVILCVLSFLSFIAITSTLIISLMFTDNISDEKYRVSALLIPKVRNTSESFAIVPLNSHITETEKDDFIKKFIKEYVVNRYTVNGSSYLMERNLGLSSLTSIEQDSVLKKQSYVGFRNGRVIWADSYIKFVNRTDGEIAKIEELQQSGTTRSVRILSEPVKNADWWSVKVEFIYRYPTTLTLSEAPKEKYQINLNLTFKSIAENLSYQPLTASRFFVIVVNYLNKEKL